MISDGFGGMRERWWQTSVLCDAHRFGGKRFELLKEPWVGVIERDTRQLPWQQPRFDGSYQGMHKQPAAIRSCRKLGVASPKAAPKTRTGALLPVTPLSTFVYQCLHVWKPGPAIVI
ncbi:hypothetical protein [Tateyamaria omphalii]|uniref:hypothetical protein n=1 Tax=Tateyamaria omphalii TaxID=299262 RepID=UPI00167B1C15|nr:hypothetical protein [Tateyamaria omphalii]